MKHILITGVSGLLGSNLVLHLKHKHSDNIRIYGVDIDEPYDDIKKHIYDFSDDLQAFSHIKFDEIYHLASVVGRDAVSDYSWSLIDSNVTLLRNIYTLWPSALLIYTSTSEVYGWQDSNCREDKTLINVDTANKRHIYQLVKLTAEYLVKQHFTNYLIIRPFNVFGKYFKQNDSRIISKFIVDAFNKRCITIYGDGLSKRSYCYVDIFWEKVFRIKDDYRIRNIAINVGSSNVFTVQEIALIMQNLLPFPVTLTFESKPYNDPVNERVFTTIYKFDTKDESVFINQLKETIKWYQNTHL